MTAERRGRQGPLRIGKPTSGRSGVGAMPGVKRGQGRIELALPPAYRNFCWLRSREKPQAAVPRICP